MALKLKGGWQKLVWPFSYPSIFCIVCYSWGGYSSACEFKGFWIVCFSFHNLHQHLELVTQMNAPFMAKCQFLQTHLFFPPKCSTVLSYLFGPDCDILQVGWHFMEKISFLLDYLSQPQKVPGVLCFFESNMSME